MTNVTFKAMRENLKANAEKRLAFQTEKGNAASIMSQLDTHFALDPKTCETRWGNDVLGAMRDAGITNFDFITHQLRDDSMFNIKALEKVSAHLRSLARGVLIAYHQTAQKYCGAIIHELIVNHKKLESGELRIHTSQFVPMFSRAARSDALASYDFATSLISVQPKTASTQASSSMRALDAIGVIEAYQTGGEKDRVLHFKHVNWDHPLVTMFARLYALEVPTQGEETDNAEAS